MPSLHARIFLLVALLALAPKAQSAETAAIVNRVEGTALVNRASKQIPLAALDEVNAGEAIEVPARSTLVVIALASGAELSFAGPVKVKFDASGSPVVDGAPPKVRAPNRPSDAAPRVRASSIAQAALVMRAAELAVPRSADDILVLLDAHRPDPAALRKHREVLERPVAANSDDMASHRERSRAAEALALTSLQITELRAALAATNEPRRVWQFRQDLFHALRLQGNFSEAILLKREMLQTSVGQGPHMTDILDLAEIYADSGNLEEARALLQQATAIEEHVAAHSPGAHRGGRYGGGGGGAGNWTGRDDYQLAKVEQTRAVIFMAAGKYQDAEAAFRRSHDLREPLLAQGIVNPDMDVSYERMVGGLDRSEQGIAQSLAMQGRLVEAEFWARKVVVRVLERLGPESSRSVHFVRVLAMILNEQGRFSDAEKLLRWSLATLDMNGASQDSHTYNLVLEGLAASCVGQRHWKESADIYDRVRAAVAKQPELETKLLGAVTWPQALYQTGRTAEAVDMLEWQVRLRERAAASRSDRLLAEARGFYGIALHRAGSASKALEQFSLAIPVLIGGAQGSGEDQGGKVGQARRARLIVDDYIDLLFEMREKYPGGKDAARDEAFRVSDFARERTTQVALAAAAGRAAADTPELATAVRELQDVEQRLAASTTALGRQLSLSDKVRDRHAVDELRSAIAALEKERASRLVALERKFPAYSGLVTPQPAALADVRRALGDGEVLLSILVGPSQAHMWLVTKTGEPQWASAPFGEKDAALVVAALRRSVDPGDVSIDQVPEFDVAAAARLYDVLVRPFEAQLAGAKTLIVAANAALAQLPFGVLVTQAVTVAPTMPRFAGYRDVPWLARRVAIAQLPSVNTLVNLRTLRKTASERVAYVGFGDPQFAATPASLPASGAAFTKRNLSLRRVTEGSADAGWIAYGELPPLPDTREEVISLAVALGADAVKDVYLGAAANRASVMNTDLSGRRIVAFATHGLLAGDFPGLDQPALALAANNDAIAGVLTLEDILGLKLDADWVVLSACNSGAGNGNGAEAISGLGRGFFYAGTRSVLVTHWPVETRAARKLVTAVFRSYAADPAITRAEALRRGMLALMDGAPALDPQTQQPAYSYAHPIFWAPYSLIGDGGR